jgi:Aspartyl protease
LAAGPVLGHGTVRRARFGAALFYSHQIRRSLTAMREKLADRRLALQMLLALGGGLCSRSIFAEPNIGSRIPGGGEDFAGVLADPEPLFAAPTRLDRIGRVMTPVMVNGKGPFRFVIDTGASRSTLSPHLAKSLNLAQASGRNVMLNGVTGAAEVQTVKVQSLEIGALKFEDQNLPVIFTSIMGNADGILGVAGFQDQRIDVDFKRDRVSVLPSNGHRPHYSMVTARAQRNQNGLMIIDMKVGRRTKVKAVIDTGAERTLGNLVLQETLNRGRKKRQPISAIVHGATPDITDGDMQEIKEARIGDLSLSNLEVIFADFHVFKLWGLDKEPAMLIGMDMLGVLERLVIDYRRNEVSMYGDRVTSRVVMTR